MAKCVCCWLLLFKVEKCVVFKQVPSINNAIIWKTKKMWQTQNEEISRFSSTFQNWNEFFRQWPMIKLLPNYALFFYLWCFLVWRESNPSAITWICIACFSRVPGRAWESSCELMRVIRGKLTVIIELKRAVDKGNDKSKSMFFCFINHSSLTNYYVSIVLFTSSFRNGFIQRRQKWI